ncbi:MAG: hypothetical protein AAGC54_01570 [Cyanobacteria bacterium P01_F01_bin.4]
MHSIDVLPDTEIQDRGEVGKILLGLGLNTFQAACRYVKAMPYGSNTNSENSLILFEEGQGTFTTKHGAN